MASPVSLARPITTSEQAVAPVARQDEVTNAFAVAAFGPPGLKFGIVENIVPHPALDRTDLIVPERNDDNRFIGAMARPRPTFVLQFGTQGRIGFDFSDHVAASVSRTGWRLIPRFQKDDAAPRLVYAITASMRNGPGRLRA